MNSTDHRFRLIIQLGTDNTFKSRLQMNWPADLQLLPAPAVRPPGRRRLAERRRAAARHDPGRRAAPRSSAWKPRWPCASWSGPPGRCGSRPRANCCATTPSARSACWTTPARCSAPSARRWRARCTRPHRSTWAVPVLSPMLEPLAGPPPAAACRAAPVRLQARPDPRTRRPRRALRRAAGLVAGRAAGSRPPGAWRSRRPQYSARHGTPQHPHDLDAHNCLALNLRSRPRVRWTFHRGGESLTVRVHGNRVADDGGLVREWAVAGLGIAFKASAGRAGRPRGRAARRGDARLVGRHLPAPGHPAHPPPPAAAGARRARRARRAVRPPRRRGPTTIGP